tara:strand:- start:24358 stop:25305 length:948 start_codon:yes stop_codon:yes gene_type:complete
MTRPPRWELFGDLNVKATPDAPIGAMTWFGIGGRADLLIRPHDEASLVTLVARCSETGVPIRILGKGANLLVDDDGVDGVVLLLSDEVFRSHRFNRRGEIERMHAGAGADIFTTVNELSRQGLSGMEQMTGIPGSLGGAIRMNAGGSYGCIADCLETVQCCTMNGELLSYHRSELEFSYRQSNLPECIILSATFNLEPSDPVAVRKRVLEIMAAKRASQPMADKSAGCTFRNPLDSDGVRVAAGRLIDSAGLKGLSDGAATVSTQHANFITTRPDANARQVRRLMNEVQKRVLDHHGIQLVPEVVVWERTGGSSG